LDLAVDGVDEEAVDAWPVAVDGRFRDSASAVDLLDAETGDALGDE